MIVSDWRPLRRGALRGFITVEFELGLTLPDCKIFDGRDGAYVSLPDKPGIKDGQLARDRHGEPIYYPVAKWRDRNRADKWSSAVIQAVRQKYPEALR